jgi:NAD-dependent DNA ligase
VNKKEMAGSKAAPTPKPEQNGASPELDVPIHPPQTMAEIPNLGPIRVRALKKAGFTSLAALQSAEMSALATVSGISETKAKQVLEYLAQFPSLPSVEPSALPHAGNGHRSSTVPAVPDNILGLQKVAAECMGMAIVLLANPPKDGWRGRVERETALFAEHAVRAITEAHTLPSADRDRLTASLKRLAEIIARSVAEKDMDRKAQAKLADDIDAVIEELTAAAS